MDLNQAIRSYAAQPLTHQLLLSLLKDYKRPNDKLHQLLSKGVLEPVRKGLYMAGPSIGVNRPEPFLLANHILGPSYISLDTALSYHGLIPERVFEIASMTTKASRSFTTPAGLFTYTHLPLPYYTFGIQQAQPATDQYVMMASPEKALCDKIVTTAGIILRSQASARAYLTEDLRMDEDSLRELNTGIIRAWLPDAPKKDSLLMIVKMVEAL